MSNELACIFKMEELPLEWDLGRLFSRFALDLLEGLLLLLFVMSV